MTNEENPNNLLKLPAPPVRLNCVGCERTLEMLEVLDGAMTECECGTSYVRKAGAWELHALKKSAVTQDKTAEGEVARDALAPLASAEGSSRPTPEEGPAEPAANVQPGGLHFPRSKHPASAREWAGWATGIIRERGETRVVTGRGEAGEFIPTAEQAERAKEERDDSIGEQLAGGILADAPRASAPAEERPWAMLIDESCGDISGRMRCELKRGHAGDHGSLKHGADWSRSADEDLVVGEKGIIKGVTLTRAQEKRVLEQFDADRVARLADYSEDELIDAGFGFARKVEEAGSPEAEKEAMQRLEEIRAELDRRKPKDKAGTENAMRLDRQTKLQSKARDADRDLPEAGEELVNFARDVLEVEVPFHQEELTKAAARLDLRAEAKRFEESRQAEYRARFGLGEMGVVFGESELAVALAAARGSGDWTLVRRILDMNTEAARAKLISDYDITELAGDPLTVAASRLGEMTPAEVNRIATTFNRYRIVPWPNVETESPHLAGMTVPVRDERLTAEAIERLSKHVESVKGPWHKIIVEEEDGQVVVTSDPAAAEARWQCGRCAAYNANKDLSSMCTTCGQNGDGSFTVPAVPEVVERPSLYLPFRLFSPRMLEIHSILSGGDPNVGAALDRSAVLWSDCERNLAILERNLKNPGHAIRPHHIAHEIVKLVHIRIWLREVFVVIIKALRATGELPARDAPKRFDQTVDERREYFVRALEGTKYFDRDRPAEDPSAYEGIAIALGWADKISVDVPDPSTLVKLKLGAYSGGGVAARAADLFSGMDASGGGFKAGELATFIAPPGIQRGKSVWSLLEHAVKERAALETQNVMLRAKLQRIAMAIGNERAPKAGETLEERCEEIVKLVSEMAKSRGGE